MEDDSILVQIGKLSCAETVEPLIWMGYRYETALRIIATPVRQDGTWNRDREACRQLAQDALDGK